MNRARGCIVESMKQNDTIDIIKYILALMVVAIHSGIFPMILYPWLRIAVPLFFMISSYIFFTRIQKINDVEQRTATRKYIIRNLKYYLFWFLLLLPITICIRRDWYDGRIISLIIKIISQIVFSSTFVASWFIVASIWGIFILSKVNKISKKLMVPLILAIYCICCVRSSYYELFCHNQVINLVVKTYETIFCCPYFSFPIALCWMYIGKMFAQAQQSKRRFVVCTAGIFVFSIALFIEWKYVYFMYESYLNDCYFMLMPLCICIFEVILNINVNIKCAKVLRTISTIMYPLHASLIFIINLAFRKINVSNKKLIVYCVVVVLCHLAAYLIVKLEKTRYGEILRYAH